MSKRVKGITVEIGGDTTKLSAALKNVDDNVKEVSGGLKDVNRLLKLDPANTVLLSQKQKLLGEAVDETKKRIDLLTIAAKQAEQALKDKTMTRTQYDALQREIMETTGELEKYETAIKKADTTTAKETTTMKDSLSKVATEAENLAQKTRGVSTAAAAIGGAAVATIPATEDLRDGMSKLKVTADDMDVAFGDAKDAVSDFYGVTNNLDSSIEATSNLINLPLDADEMASAIDLLSGAVIRFPHTLNVESLAESLQETIATGKATGQFAELLDRLGMNAEEFSGAMAMSSDESDRLDVALSYLAANGLAQTAEAWEDENQAMVHSREEKLAMQESLALLAESLIPFVTQLSEWARQFLDWFNQLDKGTQGLLGSLLLLTIGITPMLGVVSGLGAVFRDADKWIGKVNWQMALIMVVCGLLIPLIVDMLKVWDDMSGWERAIAVVGALAAALGTLAIVKAAATLGVNGVMIAGGVIIAGIAAVGMAVSFAQNRAQRVPHLADGAVLHADKPFLAMVGDQKHGTNIEAPMSTIKQGVREVMGERTTNTAPPATGFLRANLQVDGKVFARVMAPYTRDEAVRRGPSLVKGRA